MNLTIDSSVQNILFNGQDVQHLVYNGVEVWSKTPSIDYEKEYLTFEVLSSGSITWWFGGSTTAYRKSIYYSKNNGSWTQLSWSYYAQKYKASLSGLESGDKVRFRVNSSTYAWYMDSSNKHYLQCGCDVNIYGNILSLVYGDSFTTATGLPTTYSDWFRGLFSYNGSANTRIKSVENLILKYVGVNSYAYLFKNCTGLITGPKSLPATTLASYCYGNMFNGCTALTTAPELPATSLASSCYNSMFYGCTSLVNGPERLPASSIPDSAYFQMFYNCTSLVNPPYYYIMHLASQACYQMFYGCTSLVGVSAYKGWYSSIYCVSGSSNCCYMMFYNCSNFDYMYCMFNVSNPTTYTSNWLYGVKSTGTFRKNPVMSSWPTGASGIPSGWTITT